MDTELSVADLSCVCDQPGFCSRWQKRMTAGLQEHCRGTDETARAFRTGWARRVEKLAGKITVLDDLQIPLDKQEEILAVAESRGMLAGDAIAALTTAIGVPPCGGCERRKKWVNWGHLCLVAWLAGEALPVFSDDPETPLPAA